MTRDETKKFLYKIKQIFKDMFSVDTQEAYDAWCECMSDVRVEVADKALMEYLKSNKFSPTIADIREISDRLWEEHLNLVRHINEDFESAAGMYPNNDDEQRERGRQLFLEAIRCVGKPQREYVARNISRRIINYVMEVEAGNEKSIEPFDKCMERMTNEFRS